MQHIHNYNIPFNKPCLEGKEIENVLDSISSGKIAGDGKYNNLCQEEISEVVDAKRVLLTTSGTDALELCSLLYDIGTDDEVIMPSYTFVSTANAFCLRGAKPVFVDIRSDTFNIDENLIERAITDKTKAIVPVHYAGVLCDMERIGDIARKYGLVVIEDAAQGFLSTYRGCFAGTIGDAGCFSFHETKTFMCGEGGAVVLNRAEDIEKAEILREKGTNRSQFFRGEVSKYTWVGLGSSFLPSDMMGAFLYGQWCVREIILSKRKAVYDVYWRLLMPLEQAGYLSLVRIPDECSVNWHMFAILVRDAVVRKALLDYLQIRGIWAVFHYVPLHQSPYAKEQGYDLSLPVTEDIAGRVVRLPFYNSISIEEQELVVQTIIDFFEVDG